MKTHVICLPGGVAPAAQRYAPLMAAVDGRAELQMKDLEVYRDDSPPPDYSVEMEIAALERFVDGLGIDRFHLVGYSGGGFISLAFAGKRPDRLLSLGLFEPAMVPGEMTAEERRFVTSLDEKLTGLDAHDFMAAFIREQVKPGVQLPPPPTEMPPGMHKRPAGIAAMMRAFRAFRFDRASLSTVAFPVYLGYGDLTQDFEPVKAGVMARLFGDIHIQRYAGIHHFVRPEQIYTLAHARALEDLWTRGSAAELALQK